MNQLPEKYQKLAKNPPCSSTKAVNCWYCGNAFSKKSNLKAHHETTNDARHLNKSMAYYIKGMIGFLAHPDPPVILGVSENVAVDQPAEIVDDSADSNQQAGSIQTEADDQDQPSQPAKVSRKRPTFLFTFWGEITRMRAEIKDVIDQVSDPTTTGYLELIQKSLGELQALENELKHQNKKLKVETMKAEDLNNNLGLALKYIQDAEAEKLRKTSEPMLVDTQPAVPDHVPVEELAQVLPALHSVV